MGAEQQVLELIPRASAGAIAATVRAARQMRCDRLAQLACSLEARAKIERAALSPGMRRGQPGRYARIILRLKHERIAVTATVASSYASETDAFLAAALLWFTRTSERIRTPYIQKLWFVLESGAARHNLRNEIPQIDLIVTNYALLRRDLEALLKFEFRAIILDEA